MRGHLVMLVKPCQKDILTFTSFIAVPRSMETAIRECLFPPSHCDFLILISDFIAIVVFHILH